jgi:tetratricopeptide (TPR) repeat protein
MRQHHTGQRSFVRFCVIAIMMTGHVRDIRADTNPTPSDQTQQGEMFMSQGRWEEAIQTFTAALRIEPNNAALHSNLGMAYYFHGDSAAAIPELQAAVRLDQARVDALHGLGLALADRGDFEGAIAAFRVSSREHPAAYYNLGNALEQRDHRKEATAAYIRYLASSPAAPEAKALSDALRQNHFPTPAAGTAQEHLQRGQSLLEKNDADGAVAAFLAALRLKPNSVEASNGLGLAFRAAGNLDEAIAAYQNTLRLNSKFSVAYRNLGQAFEEKGDRSAAAQAYDRYLLIAPGASDAAAIRDKIATLRSGR